MKSLPNWLLVSGTGRNSGKTTFICNVIQENLVLRPAAVKISSHIHHLPEDSDWLLQEKDFSVIREHSISSKDSSRMLQAGADLSFYAQGPDEKLPEILGCLLKYTSGRPVICESGGLRNYIVPGIYIIIKGNDPEIKETGKLNRLADLILTWDETVTGKLTKSISYNNGRWTLEKIGHSENH